eukprot:TRINITY_DN9120_c0_g2_i1.p1 TRINITY_DN9120_c0_g2~~TRINITY_DN9120_c0_g2_i1.p1  ORF type:complete len:745 (+),score=105.35 TRINITY_DN9120_c0_g2_i1:65-2236(+)
MRGGEGWSNGGQSNGLSTSEVLLSPTGSGPVSPGGLSCTLRTRRGLASTLSAAAATGIAGATDTDSHLEGRSLSPPGGGALAAPSGGRLLVPAGDRRMSVPRSPRGLSLSAPPPPPSGSAVLAAEPPAVKALDTSPECISAADVRAMQDEIRELRSRLEKAERKLRASEGTGQQRTDGRGRDRRTLLSLVPSAYEDCEGRTAMQSLIVEHEDCVVSEVPVQHGRVRFTVYWCPRATQGDPSETDGQFFVFVGASPSVVALAKPYVMLLSIFSTGDDAITTAHHPSLRELHANVHFRLFAAAVRDNDKTFAYACLPPLTTLLSDLYLNAPDMLARYYGWFDNHFVGEHLSTDEIVHDSLRLCDTPSGFQTTVVPLRYLAAVHITLADCAKQSGDERKCLDVAAKTYRRVLRFLKECRFATALRDSVAAHQLMTVRDLAAIYVRLAHARTHAGLRSDRLSTACSLLRHGLADQKRSFGEPSAGGMDASPDVLKEMAVTVEHLARLYQMIPAEGDAKATALVAAKLQHRCNTLKRGLQPPTPPSAAAEPPAQPPPPAPPPPATPTGSHQLQCAVAVAAAAAADDGGTLYAAPDKHPVEARRAAVQLRASRPSVAARPEATEQRHRRFSVASDRAGNGVPAAVPEDPRFVGDKLVMLAYDGGPPEGRGFRVAAGEPEADILEQVREGVNLPPDVPLGVLRASTGERVPFTHEGVISGERYVLIALPK